MKKATMCVTREAAMLELQQLGFVLVDLNLYLDNNPNDQEAINDYNSAFQSYWEKKMPLKHNLDPWPILVTAQPPIPGAGSTNHGPGKCKGGTAQCGYMKRNWNSL